MMTPVPGMPQISGPYWQKDLYDRNKPLTDEELDALIPSSGYEVSFFSSKRLFSIFKYMKPKNSLSLRKDTTLKDLGLNNNIIIVI